MDFSFLRNRRTEIWISVGFLGVLLDRGRLRVHCVSIYCGRTIRFRCLRFQLPTGALTT